MEEKKQRPNYYILLNLSYDPIETDETVIEAAIKKETAKWNRLANNPRRGKEATAFRSMLPEIRRVMLEDAALRLAEGQNAKQISQQQYEANVSERNEQLTQALEILLSKGSINETEIKHLMNKLGVTRTEIEAALPVGIIVEEALEPFNLDEDSLLSRDKQRKIATLLQQLAITPTKGKIPTLYDFIELPEDASAEQILHTREVMAMDLQRRPISVEVSNRKDACGYVKTIFENDEERKKYDNSIQRERFSSIESMIDLAGEIGGITLQQYQIFVSKSIENGLNKVAADKLIKSYCHEKKYLLHLVQTATSTTASNMVACPKCGKFNDHEKTACDSCQTSLVKKCLNCQHVSPKGNLNCSNCNLSFEQMDKYEDLYKRGHNALVLKNLDEAEQLFQRAALIVQTPDIKMENDKIAERRKLVEDYKKQILQAMKDKSFFKAAEYINKVKMLVNIENDVVGQYETTVQSCISQVNSRLSAISLLSDVDKGTELLKIFEICNDSDWANSMLQVLPPTMPEKFEANIEQSNVKLSWRSKEPEGNVVYRIYRTINKEAAFAGDGEFVVETTALTFTDYNTVANENYWYNIYALRNDIKSTDFLKTGPVFHYAEAVFHDPILKGIMISFKWDKPLNVEVILVKKENAPSTSIHDGEIIYEGTGNLEFKLLEKLDGNYFYTLYSVYEKGGKKIISGGVTKNVNRTSLEKLRKTSFINVDEKYCFYFVNPNKENVKVYLFHSDRQFIEEEGTLVSFNALIGKYRQIIPDKQDKFVITLKDTFDSGYVLFVVSDGKNSLVSGSLFVKNIPTISGLMVVNEKNVRKLKWVWPAEVDKVFIQIQDLAGKETQNYNYTKDEYIKNDGYVLESYIPDIFEVSISSIYNHSETGETIFSNKYKKLFTLEKKITITYEIVKSGLLFKKPKLKISTDGPTLLKLPELLVTSKWMSLPLVSTDGSVIETLFGPDLPDAKEAVLDLDLSSLSRKNSSTYIRLFFKDSNEAKNFILKPVGATKI